MTAILAEENRPTFAWNATCKPSDRFTKAEPITSRHLLPKFTDAEGSTDDDLRAAIEALQEPGDRIPYSQFRKELGL